VFKAGIEYTHANGRALFLLNLRSLVGETSFTYLARPNLVIGSNFIVNPKATQQLEKYDFGVNWSPAGNAFVGLKHESINKKKIELGKWILNIHHAASLNQTVGT